MTFGSTPRDSSGIPISTVYVPGTGFIALQGSTISTDGLGNQSASVVIAVPDGADATQGSRADAANTTTVVGQLKQIQTNTALLSSGIAISSLPALPSGGNAIGSMKLLDSGGTNLAAVSAAGALKVDNSANTQPVSGTVTANAGTGSFNNASVGTTGSAVPSSASYMGGNKAGNLTALSLDGSGNLNVNVAAGGSSGGTSSSFGSAFPATGTALGASDGTNMQGLLVESSSNKNLRVGIYSGANEATITSNSLQVTQTAAQSVSATLQNAQTGNANGTTLSVLGMSALIFTVNMSAFTGTISFEGTEDGTNYSALACIQLGTNTIGTTTVGSATTSINLFETSCGGLQTVRARTSGVSAGNVTVTAHAVPVPYSNRVVNANLVAGSAVIGSTTIQATSGTALGADQSNSELRVSTYVKKTTAGDTALALGQATMANSLPVALASDQSNVPANIAQILGSAVAASNALPVNIPQIAFLLNGQVYSTSSGLQTNGATGNFPLSIFNPSNSGKSVLIISAYVTGTTTAFQAYAFPTTTDPAYASSPTLLNRKPGGSASVASASYTTTSQTLPSTTPIVVISSGSNNPYELFVNLVGYLLPSGSANGITIWNVPTGASKWASTVVWIEF